MKGAAIWTTKKGVKGEDGGKFGREWYQQECPNAYSKDRERKRKLKSTIG